jgi:hypothetical protein
VTTKETIKVQQGHEAVAVGIKESNQLFAVFVIDRCKCPTGSIGVGVCIARVNINISTPKASQTTAKIGGVDVSVAIRI